MTAPRRTRLASALAVLPLAAAVLAGCGSEDEPEATDPNPPAASSGPAEPSDGTTTEPATDTSTEPGSPSPSDGGGAEQTVAVPLYFVSDTPQGPKLFREFRNVPADNPLAEAVAMVVAGDALDPDYGTAFPEGSFASVAETDTGVALEVSDDAWSAKVPGMTARQAKLAVQQVVYTVQGVAQAEVPVRVVDGDGAAVPLFGAASDDGLKRAPQNAVLAFVNITEPAEGATVSGSFPASGVANSFEATVPWELRDGSGTKVLDGFSTAEGWMDKLYPWQTTVDVSGLAPGTYTFVALTDDPSDGEGAGPTEDSKTITVQ